MSNGHTFYAAPGAGAVAAPFRHYKVGGQVPSKERIEMQRLMDAKPKAFNPMMLLNHTEPRMTVDSVLDGLGFDNAQYSDWRKFLTKALSGDNEVVMRRNVMDKAMSDRLNPQLRRALMQRSLVHFRGRFQKSGVVDVITLDEYQRLNHRARAHYFYKAEARGGSYYRRVTNAQGKHRYYYDPEQYDRSKDAHVDGQSAAKAAIKKGVQKLLDESNGNGVELKSIKGFVKRYGSKTCSDVLKEMQKEGGLTYKGGKLGLKKSQRFVMSER